jgi:nucleotide-binding universal stress UspA family protein
VNKTILLAVDPAGHPAAAADMARDLAAGTGDRVVVLHVHEFAIGRFGKIQVDCGEGQGEQVVFEIVDRLAAAGIAALADIRRTPTGHVARTISGVADELDVRMIILGSSGVHDVPRLPFGSVSLRLLHRSGKPVLLVPPATAPAKEHVTLPRTTVPATVTC